MNIYRVDDQILEHNEVQPLEANLQLNPESLMQFWQPSLLPLSHYSSPALIMSPQVVEQVDTAPTTAVKV